MTKILRFNPNLIRKSDFNTLYSAVINITDKYNPEELHINETLNGMKEGLTQANELIIPELKSPLTNKLQDLRKKRNNYISAIVLQAKAQLKTDEEAQITAAQMLLAVTERIFPVFYRKSFNTQFALAKQFIEETEANETLKQTLTTLGVNAAYAKLSEVQQTIDVMYSNRRKVLSARKKMKTEKTKHDLYRLMLNMFTAIEGAKLEYPALDYSVLIDELNQEIGAQRTIIATRKTRSENLSKPISDASATETKAG